MTEGCIFHRHVILDTQVKWAQLRQFSRMTHSKNVSRFAVRGFIRLLWARKLSVARNHREHMELYSSDVVSGQQVGKGCSTFASGRRNISMWTAKLLSETNEHCTLRGTHFEGVTCNSLRHMASSLGLSYGTLQRIVVDVTYLLHGAEFFLRS